VGYIDKEDQNCEYSLWDNDGVDRRDLEVAGRR
jgi:hypothetical protein